jgi:glycosyltransferase involved in cell wall biosynthesis
VTAPVSISSSLTPRRWRIVHSEASLGWGGQERRIMAELEGFRRRGSEIWLLAPSESEIFRRGRQAGIACEPLAVERWKFPFAALKTAAWLRRIHPHVVNPHSSRDGWLVGVAARLARVPFILRTRHFDVPISSRHVSGFVYSRLADHVITTSPKVTAHFRELFRLPESRVSTLATGVDTKQFSPAGEAAELVPAAQQKKLPLIGMISIIRRAKGHEILLQAAQKLRAEGLQAHYVIVGEGPYLDAVRRKVRELQLTDCVMFTGHREDIPAVLRALAVLAMPSLHEGIPQVVLQALATKTPVVGSNVGGIPEIVRHGETGRIFPAGDAQALARAIRETLTKTDATRAMTERGRAFVEAHHSLDRMLETIEELYRLHLPI